MSDALLLDLFLGISSFISVCFVIVGVVVMLSRIRTLAFYGGAPFVVSSKESVKRALALADLKPSDSIADLGSGDGQILIAASPFVKHATGFEIDPLLVRNAQSRTKHLSNVTIIQQDFWKSDLSSFDVVFIFQIPYAMPRLSEKLKRECRPGTRVISNTFKFPDWTPDKSDKTVFLYLV